MSRRKNGVILPWAEGRVTRIRDLFGKSFLLQYLSHVGARMERFFRRGRFSKFSDRETGRDTWQYRFRRFCMKSSEDALLLRAFRKWGDGMLNTSIGTFASGGALCGALSASFWFLKLQGGQDVLSLLFSLILVVLSVPLLHVDRSLSYTLQNSILLGAFLFDFCGISTERFPVSLKVGAEKYWKALFVAVVLSVIGLFVPIYLLFFACLAFLILLLLLEAPELCGVLLLLFLPFFSLLPHSTLILCAAILFADLAWMRKAFCGRRRMRFGLIDFLLLLLSIFYLFAGTAGRIDCLKEGLLITALLSFWFPAVSLFSQNRWRKRAFFVWKLSAFAVSLLGIWQYFFSGAALLWVDTARFADIGRRVCGTFSNPNFFAVYLLTAAPMMLAGSFDSGRTKWWRGFDLLSFCSVALCLIFTWTRGAWLGLLLATLLFFLSFSKRSCGALLLTPIPAACAIFYLPSNILSRFSSIGLLGESSIRYRLYTWRGVLRMIAQNPWGIGIGETVFREVYPRYAVSGTETVMHAHQLFLQVTAELGIAGITLLLCFLLMIFLYVVRFLQSLHRSARADALGVTSALLGVLVMGLFDYVWYHKGMLFLFFVLCAAITTADHEEVERDESK